MPSLDPRHDAYIANAAPFARPILEYLRAVVHEACPSVEETIKWSMPNFTVNGAIVCNMAAFKEHCAFGLWKAAAVLGNDVPAGYEERSGMGSYGKLRSIGDLPPREILLDQVRRVAEARRAAGAAKRKGAARDAAGGGGAGAPSATGPAAPAEQPGRQKKQPKKQPVAVPEYLDRALDGSPAARAAFDAFPPSHRREYVEWITGAKTEATRERRLAQMLEWVAEGKSRNWKYERR